MIVPVTKPYLPKIEYYKEYIQEAFDREWLTNHGPLLVRLENQLKDHLKVKRLISVSNGTIALQLAYRALQLQGEVITTPFSYVATTSSLLWEGLTPVFADIDPVSWTILPQSIEALINKKTTAIVATHVFGIPCDVRAIEAIAKKYHLKVIYDAAHCFGVEYENQSILNWGDISTLSFHATKIFHTVEGGGVICHDPVLENIISQLGNFGHTSPTEFSLPGINGKLSEVHAAMGLAILPDVGKLIDYRKSIHATYDELLVDLPIKKPQLPTGVTRYNYAYYPVLFPTSESTIRVFEALKENGITSRRYFYPSLSKLEYLKHTNPTPIADNIASRVLCLPIFYELEKPTLERICALIKANI